MCIIKRPSAAKSGDSLILEELDNDSEGDINVDEYMNDFKNRLNSNNYHHTLQEANPPLEHELILNNQASSCEVKSDDEGGKDINQIIGRGTNCQQCNTFREDVAQIIQVIIEKLGDGKQSILKSLNDQSLSSLELIETVINHLVNSIIQSIHRID